MESSRIGPPSKSIVVTEIDGDVALYDPRRERVLILNDTASAIWRLSDGNHTLDELVELLAANYQIGAGGIREEVVTTVRRLAGEGFLSSVL